MKHYFLTSTVMGLSTVLGAFAALPATTDPTLISVPSLSGGLVVGVTGYYLQPSTSNGDSDLASIDTHPANSNSSFFSNLLKIEPSYSWGWGANIGYIFANTGNDINLTYFNLNTGKETETIATLSPNDIEPVNLNPGQLKDIFDQVNADNDYQINQVDLTLGQSINVGCRLNLHPKAGLRYAHIERNHSAQLSGDFSQTFQDGSTFNLNTRAIMNDNSDYSGIGPIAGIDASYYMGMGFGMIAHADAALLLGNINSENDLSATSRFIFTTAEGQVQSQTSRGNFTFNNDSTQRIVPTINTKLGSDYTYLLNNAANSNITFEVGYQASEYYHALDRMVERVATLEQPGNIIHHTTSTLDLNGPYASLTLHL